jgi:type I restriction enzyme S subunit
MDVPEGWTTAQLGQLVSEPIRNGYSPNCPKEPNGRWILSLSAVTPEGFNPQGRKPAPLDDKNVANFRLAVGDIVLSRSNTRSRVGLAGVYRGDPEWCAYSDLLMRLRVQSELADTDFVAQYLLSDTARRYLMGSARGTSGSMLKLDRGLVAALPIRCPPIGEQRKIAAILSSVDEVIESTRAVIDQVHVVKNSLMLELLTRGIPGRHKRFKPSEIGEVPESWEVVEVGSVFERVRQPVAIEPNAYYREIGIRSHAKGIFHKEPVSGKDLGSKSVFWVVPNALVLNIVFAWERAVATTSSREEGMVCSHRFPMYLPEPSMNAEFATFFSQSLIGNRLLRGISPGGAGRNKTLNQSKFLRLPCPKPPAPEQREIAEIHATLVARQNKDNETLSRLLSVKQALMSVLLTGELRVTP